MFLRAVVISCAIPLLFGLLGTCAPPELAFPPKTTATSNIVVLLPKTDAKTITFVGRSGIDPIPTFLLKDPRVFVLPISGLKPNKYRFTAIGSLNDEHTTCDFEIEVPGVTPDPEPPPPMPIPVPPVDPDEEEITKLAAAIITAATADKVDKARLAELGEAYAIVVRIPREGMKMAAFFKASQQVLETYLNTPVTLQIRKVIAEELSWIPKPEDHVISAAERLHIAKSFTKIATALKRASR